MANITGKRTLETNLILEVDSHPGLGTGTTASVGSIAVVNDGSGAFLKTLAADTGWATLIDTDRSNYMELYDEFISGNLITLLSAQVIGQLLWTITNVNSGTSTNISAPASNRPGSIQMSTGAISATGGSIFQLDVSNILLGGGIMVYETDVLIPTLGVTAQEFIFRCGLGDSAAAGTEPANGVYFQYAQGIGGNFWSIKTANSSTRTITTSTIAVAANTWYKIGFMVNAAASSITFYVNDVSAGTITTNIPTNVCSPFFQLVKSAGITARTVNVDYFSLVQQFTVSR